MWFNLSGVFKIESRDHFVCDRVVSLIVSYCGFLKGPVGIFYKCDYVAHMQTRLNNPLRAHSRKIEFPSQTLSLSNSRITLEFVRIRVQYSERKSKDIATTNSSGIWLSALYTGTSGNTIINQFCKRIIVVMMYLNNIEWIEISYRRRGTDSLLAIRVSWMIIHSERSK